MHKSETLHLITKIYSKVYRITMQQTEGEMMRNICEVKLMKEKSTKNLMQMLDLNETIDQLAKANSVY